MKNPYRQNIIPAGTVMNTTLDSLALPMDQVVNYSVQVVFAGTPTGNFKLQMSDDPVPSASQQFGANGVVTYTPTAWTDVANSTFTVSGAGNCMWDYQNTGATYVRLVYTDTSGGSSTATITSATFSGKGA